MSFRPRMRAVLGQAMSGEGPGTYILAPKKNQTSSCSDSTGDHVSILDSPLTHKLAGPCLHLPHFEAYARLQ